MTTSSQTYYLIVHFKFDKTKDVSSSLSSFESTWVKWGMGMEWKSINIIQS